MDESTRWERVEELFHRASLLPSVEVEAFLEQACQGDQDLRLRVSALLKADSEADGFLETPVARLGDPSEDDPGERRIGPYRVVRPLGVGGMGEVFLALEEGPDFRRYVAIKVVRLGIEEGFQERFARERKILAQLKHPGIARFLGGGTTGERRPYYVMEFVEGERIDHYADRRRLTVQRRVELLHQVCLAVQHAHSNLVVHRDLKPDNILITPDGRPKLLDFGIAKLLDADQSDLTCTGSSLATPAYAAPEQLTGGPVSTASDVYALGVLLYELLSGSRPFSPAQAAARAAGSDSRLPPAPSSFARRSPDRAHGEEGGEVSTFDLVGRNRGTTPQGLQRMLKGDLDTIVLKAMSMDPGRRYVSAAALADDLERHLEGRPVLARPASMSYRFRKFAGRHRAASLAIAALVVSLVTGAVATLAQNQRIRTQAAQMIQERDRALEVQGFLLESFGSTGADDLAGDSLTVRQVLDARADQVDQLYRNEPQTRAEMFHVLADGYERLGALGNARTWAQRAVEERRRLANGARDPDLARSLGLLGWVLYRENQLDEAEALIRESLETWRSIGSDSARLSRALNDLAGVLTTQERLEEAEEIGREAMEIRRVIYPPTHASIAITANNLGNIMAMQGRHEEALEFVRESARVLEASLGPRHRRTLFALRNMATEYAWLGDWERSAELARELVVGFEELGGPLDIDLAWALQTYGTALGRLSRLTEADSAFARGYSIARDRLGDHELTGSFLLQRAALFGLQGRPADAMGQMREAVSLYRRLYDDHPRLADALRRQGAMTTDPEEKVHSFQEAAQIMTRLEGKEGPAATRMTLQWAKALVAGHRHSEALSLFEDLQRTVPAAFGTDHAYAPAPYFGKAEAYLGLGNQELAERALEEGRALLVGGADVEDNREWMARLEAALAAAG